ncbi:DUF3369 domain-containing protein [Ectothiorhodospiraceae bacterium BW-2]|nr:DUF3369 domain-containing protein [Ectothiorhodospiraceae bacterium BW-2]
MRGAVLQSYFQSDWIDSEREVETDMIDEDDFEFIDEDESEGAAQTGAMTEPLYKPWKVAIIDDEEQIHKVTKMVLGEYQFHGRPLQFFSAYSAAEGRELFQQHHDIAVCLLDVVMESESAGLDLVKDIRAIDHNHFTRIVLRTGQPGQAPEEEVISRYDINDYKEKTELTRTKLTTLMHACLKTYEFIVQQEQMKSGLEKVLESTAKIFESPNLGEFAQGVMLQILSLFKFGDDAALLKIDHMMAGYEKGQNLRIIAGTGDYDPNSGNVVKKLPDGFLNDINQQQERFRFYYDDNYFVASYLGKEQERYILAICGALEGFTPLHSKLASIYCHNALVAFENIILNDEIEQAQWEMVYLLGGAVETRSKETGNHITRVSELSELLANKIGLGSKQAELIKWASPLHDVGKIAIPDAILNKPGKLDAEEWQVMKTHAEEGYRMLAKSNKRIIQLASRIARDHHEHWNGKGYPNGLKGEAISVEGRITAVADVFDALCSRRCYKPAWSYDKVFAYMEEMSGEQFDPDMISALISEKERVLSIYERFKD